LFPSASYIFTTRLRSSSVVCACGLSSSFYRLHKGSACLRCQRTFFKSCMSVQSGLPRACHVIGVKWLLASPHRQSQWHVSVTSARLGPVVHLSVQWNDADKVPASEAFPRWHRGVEPPVHGWEHVIVPSVRGDQRLDVDIRLSDNGCAPQLERPAARPLRRRGCLCKRRFAVMA
jgi:hypothetical protein